jgi:hypothetical protein
MQEKGSVLGGISGFGVPVDKAGRSCHGSNDWIPLLNKAIRVTTC